MSNPCKNQGFVLDDFPKTYEQAKSLFCGETLTQSFICVLEEHSSIYNLDIYACLLSSAEEHDGTSQVSSYNKKITPGLSNGLSL